MVSRIAVGIHLFRTYSGHRGRDGANFAYSEIGRLLAGCPWIDLRPHDLIALCRDRELARDALADCDVVVCTVGPHAYLYFHLREALGLRYRIVRDVRTALWNGYMLQEALLAPYIRPEDSLVFSSCYSRDLFAYLFPHIPRHSFSVCYPLLRTFPDRSTLPERRRSRGATVTIGYVGRMTQDKNFPQVLALLARLQTRHPGRFSLYAVGEGADAIARQVTGHRPHTGDMTGWQWVQPVPHEAIWGHYAQFDVLFFPSTSSLETFGRVLVEATYAGVPVFASTHGATGELLVPESLLPTAYFDRRSFTTHLAAALGVVDIEHAVDCIAQGPPFALSQGHELYLRDDTRYLQLIRDGNDFEGNTERRSPQTTQAFVHRVSMRRLRALTSGEEANHVIARLQRCFVALHCWGHPVYFRSLAELLVRSRFRRKTWEFLHRSLIRREDFTNIGGIDLQLSHLISFYPEFEILPLEYLSHSSAKPDPDFADTGQGGPTRPGSLRSQPDQLDHTRSS